eukprot:689209-Prorocentrum_lima.AAC.1
MRGWKCFPALVLAAAAWGWCVSSRGCVGGPGSNVSGWGSLCMREAKPGPRIGIGGMAWDRWWSFMQIRGVFSMK